MAILIDLIIIGILLLSTFIGYKRGLIGVAFKILSFLIAIIVTLILYKPVSSYIINKTQFATNIESTIVEKLSTQEIEEGKIKKEESNLPDVIINYVNDTIADTVNEAKDNVIKIIAKELAKTIIEIIVMIGIFIIARLLLIFAKAILEAVAEIPIIKQFNEIGGIIYGLLRGALVIFIVLAIVSFILPIMDKGTVLNAINQTILTKLLYNNNIILMIFL